jgi:hypothetical protein
MTSSQATAEVFWTAFMRMQAGERRAFLERLIADPRLRKDLLDAALIEERRHEPRRALKEVLSSSAPPQARRGR